MTPTPTRYRNRRLWLMLTLLLLEFLVGYVWGNESGYERGKADTLEEIKQRLTEPKPEALPT